MINFDFLQKIEELQIGIMHGGSKKFPFGEYFFGIEDKSSYWSHLLTNKVLLIHEVEESAKYAIEDGAKPAIYFENRGDLKELQNLLSNNNYKKTAEDSWMFYVKKEIGQKNFDLVKKVESVQDLEIFIDVFDRCYQKDDPQNVYGELGDYLKSAARAWSQLHESGKLEYFTVFDGDEPVAVTALTNYGGIGYISNVGSLRKVRGKGFGKTATLFAVFQSQKNGNKLHCLATEENTYPNGFYKRIGFETKFTALLLEKG
ncbi:MAG: hypothetical protein UU09_C0040G0009 [Microgenomates group bacterium GW2011_GWA2_40_6]|nr:MAG: hypothetical protein UU09_C0040G0009 [Microgenomates group bacterium GW2011_GWA2_40_6]